ncbi:thermonuclease family protein [Microbacterium aureliae]
MKRPLALASVLILAALLGVAVVLTSDRVDAPGAAGTGDLAGPVPVPADSFPVRIDRITDGDTVRATLTEPLAGIPAGESVPVRLIGIDTPEVYPDLECGGHEATALLARLLPEGATAWAALDAEPADRYDRALLYLWTEDGRFVNHALIAGGYATSLVVEPNDAYASVLAAAEAEARRADAGLWAACGTP